MLSTSLLTIQSSFPLLELYTSRNLCKIITNNKAVVLQNPQVVRQVTNDEDVLMGDGDLF